MSDKTDVLIVEDAEENVIFISQILEDHEYPFRVAVNGRDALIKMRARRPCLVLLDIMMPRRSGVSVFREMKKDPLLRDIPVVIITGASDVTGVDMLTGAERAKEGYADDLARGFGIRLREQISDLNPDGLIEKPIDPPVLIEKMRALLDFPIASEG